MFCVALLVYCFVFRCSKREGSGLLFHHLSDMSCFTLCPHWPVWTALLLRSFRLHVHVWVMRGGGAHICVCQVSMCTSACVCLHSHNPHSRSSASVGAAARTCACYRLQISSSLLLKSADAISSSFQPTFPTKYFPTLFSPSFSYHACRGHDWLKSWGEVTCVERDLPCAAGWRCVFLGWRALGGLYGHPEFGRRCIHRW